MKQFLTLLAFVLSFHVAHSQTDTTTTQSNLRSQILKETKQKGKLDFFTSIEGHEYDGVQIKSGIYDTKLGLALIKWGKANYELGVKSLSEAFAIFSEYKGREITKIEMDYIKIGYNREVEK